jgi:ubiquinone/menaquinone biosynthesis C-methylase UbiE
MTTAKKTRDRTAEPLEAAIREIPILGPDGRPVRKEYVRGSGPMEVKYIIGENIRPHTAKEKNGPGLSATYSRYAETPTQIELHDTIIDAIASHYQGKKPTSIRCLEAGIGGGGLAQKLAQKLPQRLQAQVSVVGVDTSDDILNQAALRLPPGTATLIKGNITELAGIGDGSIDAITCNATIHHLKRDDKIKALKQFRRVLADGGILAIGEWDFSGEQNRILGPDGQPAMESERRQRMVDEYSTTIDEARQHSSPKVVARLEDTLQDALEGRREYPWSSKEWLDALAEAGFKKPAIVKKTKNKAVITAEK